MNERQMETEINNLFDGKVLLVTGGTGTIGNAFIKRLISTKIKEIRVFSRDEKKQYDMQQLYKNDKLQYYIGDIRDVDSVRNAMKGVDFVLHAAAMKQVPTCESFPIEAIKTNVMGTDNVIRVAIEYNIEKIVCVSTDKAVYPISAMGKTKALMESVALAYAKNSQKTKICLTRFGNILYSRGSVVPLFIKQIMNGEKLTVTDPDMTRFIMDIDEAVDLLFFAFVNGRNGDICVHVSSSVAIKDLVVAILELFNKKIQYDAIGIRSGERMHENLLTNEETMIVEEVNNFYRINKILLNSDKPKAVTKISNRSFDSSYKIISTELIKEKLLQDDNIKYELEKYKKISNLV